MKRQKFEREKIMIDINTADGKNINWGKATIFNRPHASVCDSCGKKFIRGELFAVRETKVSWFRGEDEVDFLCKECTPEPIRKVLKI